MNSNTFLLRANPKLILVMSRALAALRPSLIAFLVANAQTLSGGTETPISFCNVLFVGNLCAAIAVVAFFGWSPIMGDLRQLSPKILIGLLINGCLAALLSSLIYLGLEYTMVTNAVLLGRLGPIIYAVVGALIWGKTILKSEWFGFSLIVLGILAIVLVGSNFQINRGDLLILGSTLVYATTSTIGKFMLSQDIPLRTVVFTRNFISAVVFFAIANIIFGFHHFSDAFSGQLWLVMAIYAVIIIVLAQILWYSALGRLDSKVVGKWTSLSPIFGVIYAFVLNGERPANVQFIAFAIIMTGIWITTLKQRSPSKDDMNDMAVGGESSAS